MLDIFFLRAATRPSFSSDSEIVGTLFFCPPCHALFSSYFPWIDDARFASAPTPSSLRVPAHPSRFRLGHASVIFDQEALRAFAHSLYLPPFIPGSLLLSWPSNVPCTFICRSNTPPPPPLIHACFRCLSWPSPAPPTGYASLFAPSGAAASLGQLRS